MSSKTCITLSSCPYVYGWSVVLKLSLVLKASWSLPQNIEVNLRSRSEVIDNSTLFNLTISYTHKSTNFSRKYYVLTKIEWVNFVSLSTTTQTESFFLFVAGNPYKKSIVTRAHFHSGIITSCNNQNGTWCSTFTYWQTRHLVISSKISHFIASHQYICFKTQNILVLTKWMECVLL